MSAAERPGAPGEDDGRRQRSVPVARRLPRRSARDRLRLALASPRRRREAFLLHEVLGAPVALRDGPADRPG